jgi:antitoxin component of MazEF toxin-antitoxin module
MIKTLQPHGNSKALVIEKPLLEALGIGPKTQLQITVSGNSLVVTPLEIGVSSEELDASLRKLRPRYKRMLQRLAK